MIGTFIPALAKSVCQSCPISVDPVEAVKGVRLAKSRYTLLSKYGYQQIISQLMSFIHSVMKLSLHVSAASGTGGIVLDTPQRLMLSSEIVPLGIGRLEAP